MKALIVLLTGMGIVGCGDASLHSNDIQAEIDKFHTAYNAADYDAIYANGSANFRCSIDPESLAVRLAIVQSTFGKFESSDFFGINFPSMFSTLRLDAVRSSIFEHREITERFYFVREGGEYRLNRFSLMFSENGPVYSEDGVTATLEEGGFALPIVSLDCI